MVRHRRRRSDLHRQVGAAEPGKGVFVGHVIADEQHAVDVELVADRAAKTPASDAAEAVLYRALGRGLSFKISLGNVLTLTPPLIVTEREMDMGLDILEACIAETERELSPS